MDIKENRLKTFQSWPNNPPVSILELANEGFFAIGNPFTTQCNWCDIIISDWKNGDQVMVRHKNSNPSCPLISNRIQLENLPELPIPTNMKSAKARMATFINWPNPYISPQSLVIAGFYYINIRDHVRCAWCSGTIGKWELGDDAFVEHKKYFPVCPFVMLGPLTKLNGNSVYKKINEINILPRKPQYANIVDRLRTYNNWPINDIQSPKILAEAGFYYTKSNDYVNCFHCDGILRSWEKQDDPWFEHAKWFPGCQFILLIKGQKYINDAQKYRKNETLRLTRSLITGNTTELNLNNAMQTEPAKIALEMGLNEENIKNAMRRHLQMYNKPYDKPEDLIEAVLEFQDEEENDNSYTDEDIDRNNTANSSSTNEYSHLLNSIPDMTNNINLNKENDSPVTHNDATAEQHKVTNQENIDSADICEESNSNPDKTKSTNDKIERNIKEKFALEEENRKLKDVTLCKICMDDEVGIVFLPCGHLVTCVQCSFGIQLCPLCRKTIKGVVRTFLS